MLPAMARKRTRRLFGVGVWLVLVGSGTPAQAPEPSRHRLEGVVLDALAQPIAMADVWVAGEGDDVLARGKTDGAGRFVLGGLPATTYWRVHATTPGRIEAQTSVRPRDGLGSASLRLYDAAILTGRVLDPDGQAIAGAEVAAAFTRSRAISFGGLPTTTDAEGRFRLEKVPLGVVDVWAVAADFVASSQRVHVTAESTVDVRLARGEGLTIEVEVEGLTAEEAATVRVDLRPYTSGGLVFLPRSLVLGRLDASGKWRVRGLPQFQYFVTPWVTRIGFQPREIELFSQHRGGMGSARPESPGKTARASFRAFRSTSVVLKGRVVDADGKGLAGETVVGRAANGGEETTAITDADGAFALASPLAPGSEGVFFLRGSQYVPDQAQDDMPFFDPGHLLWHRAKIDPQRDLLIKTIRTSRVRGRLVDPEGASVPFVRVAIEASLPNRVPRWTRLRSTDASSDGTFELVVHAIDAATRVAVTDGAGSVVSDEFDTKPGSLTDVGELKLAPAASVAGVVRDVNQKPVVGARVWLRDWDFGTGSQKSGSVVEVITDRAGRYRFPGVPAGGAWLQVMLHQDHPRERAVGPFEVTPGSALTFDLVLGER